MAARVMEPMEMSREDFDDIFGSSDEEMNNEDSDIDVSEVEDESDENDTSGSESEGDEPVEWTNRLRNIHMEDFTSPAGITFEIGNEAREIDIFKLFFNDEILNVIVRETNRYARQKLVGEALDKWQDVTLDEVKVFLGVSVAMGLNPLPSTADYWSSDPFLGNEGIQKVMTKNRFEHLSRFFHFNDSSVEPRRGEDGYDRLYKVRPILSHFNAKIQELYKPTKHISVDEGMIGFKGRLSFRQYMPAKPTKYGIKVWMAADASNGFVVNHEVYLGKQPGRVFANGLGYSVVMELMAPFLNKNHHVYFDNFFSSPKLLEDLQNEGTYACSTVRAGRTGLPPSSRRKLKREGEMICEQKGNLVYTKWHDKRDVNILSTNFNPLDPKTVKERRKKNGDVVHVEKPACVDLYNNNMGGVDRSDQLRSYYSACRPSKKWYKYLFWFIFDLSLVNSFIIFKENVHRRGRRTLANFRLALAKQLIGGFSSRSENRKRTMKAASLQATTTPGNAAGHFCIRREGNARKRHCVQCKKDGRKTPSDRAKETIYECAQCGIALCKDPCFKRYHNL